MHRFQTLCRLQMHKFASEQMIAGAAFIDPLYLADSVPEPSEGTDEANAKPRSGNFSGSKGCPGDQVAPVRQHTKEKTACISQ